jgi:hypothetical protein
MPESHPAPPALQPPAPPAPPAGWKPADAARLAREASLAGEEYAARVVNWESGLEYPLSAPQRLALEMGIRASYAVVDIDQPWDPGRFAGVWRGVLANHPILRSAIDPAAGLIRELDLADWGTGVTVHLDLSAGPEFSAQQVIDQLTHQANPFAGLDPRGGRLLAHRLVTVARPGGGFTAVMPVSYLAFDAFSHAVLARELLDGYAAGGPGTPHPLPYSDYLRFVALGPRRVEDQAAAEALQLERFAAAAQAFSAQVGSERVDVEHELNPDSPAEALVSLVEDALIHAQGGEPVPLLLIAGGRNYRDGDFTRYVGQFADLVPVVAGPAGPGLLTQAAEGMSFLRRHNLTVTSMIADPLIAARCEYSAGLLGQALGAGIPLLNLALMAGRDAIGPVIRGGDQAGSDAGGGAGRIIDVRCEDGHLLIRGLPCRADAVSGFAGADQGN